MAFEKDPNELGLIYWKQGQEGTAYADTKFWNGRAFDIPEGVPVIFVAFEYVMKKGKDAGKTAHGFRVLLAPPPEEELGGPAPF